MERVWKRVAQSRRRKEAEAEAARRPSCYRVAASTPADKVARDFMWCDMVATGSDSPQSPPPPPDERRQRRTPKTFSLNLDSKLVMELNPKALTKRFCSRAAKKSKKQDNELYRSNSFHFKRYTRPENEHIQKQVGFFCLFAISFVTVRRLKEPLAHFLADKIRLILKNV